MAYTNIFGGSTVQPSDVSYRKLETNVNYQYSWPQTNQDNTTVIARINDIIADAASLKLNLPDATLVSVGQDALFKNVATNAFTVCDMSGNTIISVPSGMIVYIYLTDNSTQNGVWNSLVFGASASAANASQLAGFGLRALNTTLNQVANVSAKNANYLVLPGDQAGLIQWTGGTGTFTFTAAGTLGGGWFTQIKNSGTGTLTLDPNASETIDGSSTLILNPNESLILICDGANFFSVGFGRSITNTTTRLVKSVAGGTDVTLTASEAAFNIIEFTGTLTANINVIFPTQVAIWYVYNHTVGAFTLTTKSASGTGVLVVQGTHEIIYCDGTNIVFAVDISSGTVTSIATGTGLTGGPITTSGTIAVATNGITDALFRQAQALSVVGNSSNATANTADILFATDGDVIKRSGTALVSGKIQEANINSGAAANGTVLTANGTGGVAYLATSRLPQIGTLFDWPTSTVPTGALVRNGSAVSRTTYASLFGLLVTSVGFTSQTFTVTIAAPAVFTKVTHGFLGGERIRLFTTGALPTGLTTGIDYYVLFIDANTFNLASTFGGTAITTTGTQSGTQTYLQSLYGLGDGTTTFNVPNDTDLFTRGWNSSTRGFGTQQADALQNITGSFSSIRTQIGAIPAPASGAIAAAIGNNSADATGGAQQTTNFTFDASRVARTSTETRPVNRAYLPCIQAL